MLSRRAESTCVMRASAALDHGELGEGRSGGVVAVAAAVSDTTSARMEANQSAQRGDEATSKSVLVMLMTDDWMAAKHKQARRRAMTSVESSVASQCERAWLMAHWT